MFLTCQTIQELLAEKYTIDEFYDIIDETMYQTKNFDIIAALGMVKACLKENGTTDLPLNVVKMSKKLGPIDIYTSVNYNGDMDTDNIDLFESEKCFVSDCESCDNVLSKVSEISIESDNEDEDTESFKSFKNFKPSWMLNDTSRVLTPEFQNQLNTSVDLKQKTFCVTGLLKCLSRDQFHYYINFKNGNVSKNMKKSVDYLVVGMTPGKTKVNLAKKYKTKMITENEAIDLLTQNITNHAKFLQERNQILNEIKTEIDSKSQFNLVQQELRNTVLPSVSTIDTSIDWTMDWSILDGLESIPPAPNTPVKNFNTYNTYVNRIV